MTMPETVLLFDLVGVIAHHQCPEGETAWQCWLAREDEQPTPGNRRPRSAWAAEP
jgi:hypothetical protein